MQHLLDHPPVVSQATARQAAVAYVHANLDPAFQVAEGTRYRHKIFEREVWQFIICSAHGPLDALYVDAETGVVIPLTLDEIHVRRERARIAEARRRGVLPIDDRGYVLAEYARRTANGYLSMEVSLFCYATDAVLIPLARPLWQFAIRFGLPHLGELGLLGLLDVDAQSGDPIPLSTEQIERMRVRADALVEFQTQPTAA